jgi:hypothetical protein
MDNWAKFRGIGTLAPTEGYDRSRGLNFSQWIERFSHQSRLDRVEVAHLRIKTRRNSSAG